MSDSKANHRRVFRSHVNGTRLIVLGLLLIHACLVIRLAQQHTPTYDETAHLPAGLYHWQTGSFSLYRVNPPLVRMLASLPILASSPELDLSGIRNQPGSRDEFRVGKDFVTVNAYKSFRYFSIARWVGVLFSVLGAYLCYRWAVVMWGHLAGLITLTLWCFDPNILGNAQTIQPDLPAATMAVAITYWFWGWCRKPSFSGAFAVGILLGLGLLTKTTILFMLPLLPILWICRLKMESSGTPHRYRSELKQLALILLIGLCVFNLGYGFEGTFRQLGDFRFVSESLKQQPTTGSIPEPFGNRFNGTFLGHIPVPFPADFVLGIDEQKRDFEGRLHSYLRGETRRVGWWYYYLYAMLVKIPIGTQLIFCISVFVLFRKGISWPTASPLLFVALPALTFVCVISSVTGMTNHMRYVLPAFPFLFMIAGSVGELLVHPKQHKWLSLIVSALLIWVIFSSLGVFPHSHSYFNEFAGGPENGHRHLLSSNIDYGEDLFFLRDWLDQHQDQRSLTLAYFGDFDPRVAGIKYSLPPNSPEPGLHAISVNYLHGTSVPLHDGQGKMSYGDDYSYFLQFKPVAMAGYGIYIYDLSVCDIEHTHLK